MHTKNIQQHTETRRGFTLVETLVAITVLILAIVGPMTIAARGLQSTYFAQEQITAFYLGQEAMEYIRSIRDENALADSDWLSGIDSACMESSGCDIDVRDGSFRSCSTESNCTLDYDDAALDSDIGFYNHGTGDVSAFTRVITVDETVNDQEAEVTVTMNWDSTLYPKTITLQSTIFNHFNILSGGGSGGEDEGGDDEGGEPTLVSLNQPAVASSQQAASLSADKAFDGSGSSRWGSGFSDPQWIYVDLGSAHDISRVKIDWEFAYGEDYTIQVSDNASSWTTIETVIGGNGGTDDLTGLSGTGRYVRMYGTDRGTGFGYSIYEMEVYGTEN